VYLNHLENLCYAIMHITKMESSTGRAGWWSPLTCITHSCRNSILMGFTENFGNPIDCNNGFWYACIPVGEAGCPANFKFTSVPSSPGPGWRTVAPTSQYSYHFGVDNAANTSAPRLCCHLVLVVELWFTAPLLVQMCVVCVCVCVLASHITYLDEHMCVLNVYGPRYR
jgi:hypothetical protein